MSGDVGLVLRWPERLGTCSEIVNDLESNILRIRSDDYDNGG